MIQAPDPFASALQNALAHHQAGRLAEAEALYRQILARNPNHAEALHLLGLLAFQVGRADVAQDLMGRALQVAPNHALACSNYAEVLRRLGRPEQAETFCRRALEIDPNLSAAHTNLATLLQSSGRKADALPHARRAVELAPQDGAAHRVLGTVLMDAGNLAEAAAEFDRSLQLAPNDSIALTNRGVCWERQGQPENALPLQQKAVSLAPDSPEIVNNLGLSLVKLKRFSEALECFRRALQLKPDHIEAMQNLGSTHNELRQFEQALPYGRRVVQAKPKSADGYTLIANALQGLGRFDEALAIMRQAVAAAPDAGTHKTLALVHVKRGELEPALAALNAACAASPENTDLLFDKSLLLLLMGRLAEAWPLYEHRLTSPRMKEYLPTLTRPRWQGEPLEGRRLLVFAEQGLGDTVHFVRYVPLLAARGAKVILQVQPELQSFISSIAGAAQVVSQDDPPPPHDLQVAFLSLPGLFGTTLANIPAQVPYLAADPQKVAAWRQEFAGRPAKFRVGLAWEGGAFQPDNHLRSAYLQAFAPLASIPGVAFYGLQKGPAAAQVAHPPAGMDFTDLAPRLADFSDTAAIIANLDLLISIDTSVVHVAGALARPVWTLLAHNPGHMWMRDRLDTPWYPTMRLFRQPAFRDWPNLMREVAATLRPLVRT